MDGIEQRQRLARLVGLQRTDEMQLDVREFACERAPFGLRLLHAVLPEDALTRRKHGPYRVKPETFRDGDQRRCRRGFQRCFPRGLDTGENFQ